MLSLPHHHVVPSPQQAMDSCWLLLLGLWTVTPIWAGDRQLNVCMDAKHHKPEPGPEDKLYEEVQRPGLAQGMEGGCLGKSGEDINANMVPEPPSMLTSLVP